MPERHSETAASGWRAAVSNRSELWGLRQRQTYAECAGFVLQFATIPYRWYARRGVAQSPHNLNGSTGMRTVSGRPLALIPR